MAVSQLLGYYHNLLLITIALLFFTLVTYSGDCDIACKEWKAVLGEMLR
jgi:hypothetical protein